MQGATELYIRCMSAAEREQVKKGIQAQKAAAQNRLELLRIAIFEKACNELWTDESSEKR